MAFNEDSRVKIPSLAHLTRLGWTYLSLRDQDWNADTNIFPALFKSALKKVNSDANDSDLNRLLLELSLLTQNEDLGQAFHERLTATSGLRLIDFENFDNNSFHVVTELPCVNSDDEFRPDITLLINGIPLAFIEVKKPNNRDGILAERRRMDIRQANPAFRSFLNLTQITVFSNNMEYDDNSTEPLEGAFYSTPSSDEVRLNYFREEDPAYQSPVLPPLDQTTLDFIIADNNIPAAQHAAEFTTNLSPDTPTNRLSTSLFMRQRLAFFLRFGIAHVSRLTDQGTLKRERHIMRYPQFFASQAIVSNLSQGIKSGIIWHTQGSGKTALAYHCVPHLTAYFQKANIVPKFYFIVDRLDLLTQAKNEFSARGLRVHTIQSRDAFAREIRTTQAVQNNSGVNEITVVNIQKFKDDDDVLAPQDYSLNLQRIYFLDEVHRSYNPEGSFLANLKESDPEAIHLGLTGTPLIGENSSRQLFGDYLHKYYYNRSIADGYTLRLIREEMETSYRMQLAEQLEDINIQQGSAEEKQIFASERYVTPLLEYIVTDLEKFRVSHNDTSLGGMVICHSSDQAREMARLFEQNHVPAEVEPFSESTPSQIVAEENIFTRPRPQSSVTSSALILHDVGSKEERKQLVEKFKAGGIDLIFVFNMLLTGFDAPRLKKLYLGRRLQKHNLLQALTRVNRTYKSYRYGYVVDFADIRADFESVNQAYLAELQNELGDELEHFSNLFLSQDEVLAAIESIRDSLFEFDLTNSEVFSQQISEINDRLEIRPLVKALNDAKSLYNLIRLSGQHGLLKELDFRKLTELSRIANDRLGIINLRVALETQDDNTQILNQALEEIYFSFAKISEEEMRIADELRDTIRRTRETLARTIDPADPQFISLREELERIFRNRNLNEVSQEEMERNIAELENIRTRALELERKNKLILAKFQQDEKYTRIYKRLLEKGDPTPEGRKLMAALAELREETEARIAANSRLLTNSAYARDEITKLIITKLRGEHQLPLTPESTQFIQNLVMQEYLGEFGEA